MPDISVFSSLGVYGVEVSLWFTPQLGIFLGKRCMEGSEGDPGSLVPRRVVSWGFIPHILA